MLNDSIEGLQLRMRASSLLVGLRRSPPIGELQQLPGVEAVEAVGDDSWRLHYRPEHNPAEQLALEAARRDWGLYELIPERMSLEQVFVDITRSDPTEHDEGAAA